MATFKDLISQVLSAKKKVENSIENGKKTRIDKRTAGFYKQRLIDLTSFWNKFVEADTRLEEFVYSSSDEHSHSYIAEKQFDAVEVKYSEYVGELHDGLHSCLESANPDQSNSQDSRNFPSTSELKPCITSMQPQLPKINLPKFDGDYNSWRSFHDLFTLLVHNNTQIQAVQKLHYLKTCLVGEAERVLRHTPVTNADYAPAWQKLKARYENKRALVNHQLRNLFNQAKLTTESHKGLKMLVDNVEECLQQLKALKVDTSSWDILLIYLIVQKLPFATLRMWEEELKDTQDLPDYETFIKFLHSRIRVLESIGDAIKPKPTLNLDSNSRLSNSKREITQVYHTTTKLNCPACNGKHYVGTCHVFLKLDIPERRRLIKETGKCFNCFSSKHSHEKCQSKYRCHKCKQLHHTTLHASEPAVASTSMGTTDGEKGVFQSSVPLTDSASGSRQTPCFLTTKGSKALMSTALVSTKCSNGQTIILRCLLDTGSESSFITESAYNRVKIVGTPASVQVVSINKRQAGISNQQVHITLSPVNSETPRIETDVLVVETLTDFLPSREIRVPYKNWQHIEGLNLADPTFWKSGPIDVLLGTEVCSLVLREGLRLDPNGAAPTAVNTIFGWVLLGKTTEETNSHTKIFSLTVEPTLDLDQQMRKFWEIEEVRRVSLLTPDEGKCDQHYKDTYCRLPNGQYQVQLPFSTNNTPILGDSRSGAIKRYHYLQKKLATDPLLKQDYEKCLDEYIDLGHMTACEPPQPLEENYYIPHHAVFKQSSTTKLRVVFDASAKTTNGKSLNEQLLVGPTIQPGLFTIILNWMKYKVAMTADVEKMYRMVWVHPSHRTYQRIIWRHPETQAVQDYQLNTVTFGMSPAPYLAIRTLQQLAYDEKERWPLASNAVSRHFYVDDLLTGADSLTEAKELQRQLIEMLKQGGFNLRKWASNCNDLLDHLPNEYRELKLSFDFSDNESIKALGIKWYPHNDYFTFSFNQTIQDRPITKRNILSEISSLFDPLGWISPVIITAKILIQTLWISGCTWDTPIPDTLANQWRTFKQELPDVEQIKIPRWIGYSNHNENSQLLGFCDASIKAYSAVLYLRTQAINGETTVSLLTSKTKVAPLKPTTLPRLELNGALLLARLLSVTVQEMQLQNTPIYAWTDSTIVLQWIRQHPSRWKTYVANRVAEIQDILPADHWHHVSTSQNPADLASRGISVKRLTIATLWWHGPDWLIKDQDDWPKSFIPEEQTDLEAKQANTTNLFTHTSDQFLTKYSSYTRLTRIVATILRFIYNCQNPNNKQTQRLSYSELSTANITILRLLQQITLSDDYKALKHDKLLSRKSRLLRLNPFLDHDGLIRVGGRLEHAHISYQRKHPIILPRDHHISRILIDKTHKETLHGGTMLVLNTMRNQFWILDGKRAISKQLYKCITCARQRQRTSSQIMGNLPAPRINITRAFSHVGIDYAGPIYVKASPIRNSKIYKGYFCIFVCLATKAIHIEAASNMTLEVFLAAMKRFVARRGVCSDIYSDCGTNFKGGKTLLDKDLAQALREAIPGVIEYLSNLRITWHFNPPVAPHQGGLWEAGVKSVKHHLRRVMGTATYTFEEITTLLTQIEACLNSRPLCPLQNDPDELAVLTPGHFLIGQPLNALPEPNILMSKTTLGHRWKHIQQMVHHFWKDWSQDYLNRLQNRPKWWNKQQNLKIGDVVLVKEENYPPTFWPLGIIEDVHPGKDNMVRVVTVRTRGNMLQRPIQKICRLPIDTIEDLP